MDTIPITLHISTSKDNKTNSDTDLSIVDMEDEIHPDLSIGPQLRGRNCNI